MPFTCELCREYHAGPIRVYNEWQEIYVCRGRQKDAIDLLLQEATTS